MSTRPMMPWFATELVKHYENPTEPSLFPHKYTRFIEKLAYDKAVLELKGIYLGIAAPISMTDARIQLSEIETRIDRRLRELGEIE